MKTIKLTYSLLAIVLFILLTGCPDREVTNPFDTNCPKELFTPSDFKAEQQGAAVKLSWKQTNTQISGFVINRNENDGAMTEVAKTEKAVTTWSDETIIGGNKYGYQLVAYAGDNLSNLQKVVITPVTGAVVITASSATDITPFSAIVGGNVTGDGGAAVTERGFCYGTSQNPTTANSKVVVGNGTGEFSGTITSLTANTTYYAKAYAINSQGTTYGNQITFNTPPLQLSVSPAIYEAPKESGSRVFTVTSNIDWQVASDQTWCKTNITSSKGNSPVVATFETNTAIGQRSALLTFSAVGVSNQIVVVTQAGTEPPVLTITPDNQNVTNTAGTTTFTITSNVSWTATSDQTWCTITNTSGTGNGTFNVNYEANTTNSQRIANLSITGLGLSAKTVTITQQSALPTDGLVAYYPFNGNANDESGNGNNGIVYGATLTVDRKGIINSAYRFNGSDNYIKYPLLSSSNVITISLWFYWENTSANEMIFYNGFADRNGFGLLVSSNNGSIGNKLGIIHGGLSYNILSNSPICPNNIWKNVIVIKENNLWKLLIDSQLISTGTGSPNLATGSFTISYIANHFKGKIDDIRIYNRTLTETEIQQLYNE
jgi:hypothetical protein